MSVEPGTFALHLRLPAMHLLLGLLSYLTVATAIIGGGIFMIAGASHNSPKILARGDSAETAPRIQAWLDRNAEALVYEEKDGQQR